MPESGAAGLASQLELPRLQSTWKAARPSSPKVTVYFDGSSMTVLGCSSGAIDSIFTSRQVVPVSGSAAAAEPQPIALTAAMAATIPPVSTSRMAANLPA